MRGITRAMTPPTSAGKPAPFVATGTAGAPIAKIIGKSRLSDGAWDIALGIDDGTDWATLSDQERTVRTTHHTIYADANGGVKDSAGLQAWLLDRKKAAVARHQAMAALDAAIPSAE